MKVKQLIYTSWKNGSSTRKGFMVYSKSEGISPEDENAITANMRYTALPSLPYTPTREEIENLFPRNVSYFRLPSGGYCFAQSCYLGKDYSGRTGNYIIHAYVSEEKPDFNQFNLIGSDIFKRSMTEEELAAESNPPALPEVEITVPDNPDDIAALKEFFTPDKKDNLRYFVEAVLKGLSGEGTVYAFDDQKNLALWYKALSYCLPKMMLSQVTFSTYSCYVPNDIAVACIKQGAIFNYDMNLAMGGLVYNFKENKINGGIQVSGYTDRIVDEFYADPEGAAAYAASIEEYMEEAGGDLLLAISLSKFYSGAYSSFDTPEALGAVFGCVTSSGRMPADELGDVIGDIVTANPSFTFAANGEMFRYAMANGSEDTRFAIIKQYADARLYAPVDVSAYEGEYMSLVLGAPFGWKEFLTYVNKKVGKDKFVNACGVTSFAAYVLVSTVLDYGSDLEVNDKFVSEYARTIADLDDLALFEVFFNKLIKKGTARIVVDRIASGCEIFNNNNYSHSFRLLRIMGMQDVTTAGCAFMIRSFADDPEFRACAEKFLSSDDLAFAEVEKAGATDPAVKKFVDDMISVRFLAQAPDDAALDEFYVKYYARNDVMKDVFYSGLKKRLSSEQLYTVRAGLALNWYERISSDGAQTAAIMQIAKGAIFDGKAYYIEFARLYKQRASSLDAFVKACRANGSLAENYYDVAALAAKIRAASRVNRRNYKKNVFISSVLKDGLLSPYTDCGFIGRMIAENYTDDVFALYAAVADNEPDVKAANEAFMNNVLSPLVECADARASDAFRSRFNASLSKLKGETYLQCASALIWHATQAGNEGGALAYCTDGYFKAMQKKKIEKFYSDIKKSGVYLSDDMKKYIEAKINSAVNVGFFARIFGKR